MIKKKRKWSHTDKWSSLLYVAPERALFYIKNLQNKTKFIHSYARNELKNLSIESEDFLSNFNIYTNVIVVFNGLILTHFEIMLTDINIPQNSIGSVLIVETMSQLDNTYLELKLKNIKISNRFLKSDFDQIFYSENKNLV